MMFLAIKNKKSLVYCFLICSLSFSQKVYVEDKNTGEPIENVAVYSLNKLKSTITNSKGEATIDDFKKSIPVIFQINGYDDLKIIPNNYKEIIYVQMNPKIENLDGIILSVARSKTAKNKIAEKVNIIDAKQIEKNIIQTGAEILELSPGVRVQKSQGGGGSPVLRGFEANRVLLVIDGVRMNNAIYRSGHLQNAITISPHILDRVEVTFGSSSVGYGSDALGGVIHYYTKTPDINSDVKNRNKFHSDFNYANMSSVNNITSNWSFKNWGSITSINFSSFGDIKMGSKNSHGYNGWGLTNFYSENTNSFYKSTPTLNPDPLIQKNTGYNQIDLFQKFRFKFSSQNYLSINLQLSNSSNINRYDKLSEVRDGNLRFAQWYYGPQKRFLFSPKFEFFKGSRLLKSGVITLAYQDIKESRVNRKFESFNKNHQFERVSILSLNADFSAKPSDEINTSYGVEIIQNIINSDAYSSVLSISENQILNYVNRITIPSRYPSNGSYYKSAAGYINIIWDINKFLSLNFGSRITYTDLGGSWKEEAQINSLLSEVSINNWAITNTIAAIYNPLKKMQLNFVLSSGFRNPNIDDIGKIRESGGFLIVPNPFLKPEYAYNFDTGVSYESDNGLYSFSLRGFGSLISRHIVRSEYIIFSDQSTDNPNTILFNGEEISTLANKNLGNRYVYGGSFESSIKLNEKLHTKASLTYTRGNKSFKNGPMPSIPPFFGNYSINYNGPKFNAQIIWNFSNAKNPNDYSYGGEDGLEETPLIFNNQYAGTPAWEIFSTMINYRYNNYTSIKLGLNNIFDTHYRTFASGISQPGRSIQLGISIDF